MKSIYSQQELIELSKEHFKRLGVRKLYATSDGQFFLLYNRAFLHAKGRNIYTMEADGDTPLEAYSIAALNALQGNVNAIADLNELHDMLLEEVGGSNDVNAVSVIQARIDELVGEGEGTQHTITEEDLQNNPDLKDQGVNAGEDVTIPAEATVKAAPKKAAQPKTTPAPKKTAKAKK